MPSHFQCNWHVLLFLHYFQWKHLSSRACSVILDTKHKHFFHILSIKCVQNLIFAVLYGSLNYLGEREIMRGNKIRESLFSTNELGVEFYPIGFISEY